MGFPELLRGRVFVASTVTFMPMSQSACSTSPSGAEATREIVLQYIGHDVGTLGPFSKQAKHELAAVSATARRPFAWNWSG
jgi:hypothetical protein